jgi:hypothetical protein
MQANETLCLFIGAMVAMVISAMFAFHWRHGIMRHLHHGWRTFTTTIPDDDSYYSTTEDDN